MVWRGVVCGRTAGQLMIPCGRGKSMISTLVYMLVYDRKPDCDL